MARQPAKPKYQKSVYFSVEDWELVHQAAKIEGLSATQYIVGLVVDDAKYVVGDTKLTKDDDQHGL